MNADDIAPVMAGGAKKLDRMALEAVDVREGGGRLERSFSGVLAVELHGVFLTSTFVDKAQKLSHIGREVKPEGLGSGPWRVGGTRGHVCEGVLDRAA